MPSVLCRRWLKAVAAAVACLNYAFTILLRSFDNIPVTESARVVVKHNANDIMKIRSNILLFLPLALFPTDEPCYSSQASG